MTIRPVSGTLILLTPVLCCAEIPILWVDRTPPPVARGNARGATIGEKLYIAGGHKGGVGQADLQMYDVASDSWHVLPNMQEPRSAHGAFAYGDSLYAFGGSSTWSAFHPSMERYDPSSETWTYVRPLPAPIRYFGAARAGDTAYVVGGQVHGDWAGQYRSEMLEYDIQADTWTRGPNALLASSSHVTIAHDSRLYTFGGLAPYAASVYDKTQIYDISAGEWTFGADMPTAVLEAGAGVFNDKIYVIGGHDDTGPVSTVQVYDPGSDQWDTGTSLPAIITCPVVTSHGGRLYVTDGPRRYEGIILPTVGDANLDGVIDDDDLSLLLANWTGPEGSGKTWRQGDFEGDQSVSQDDLSLLLAHWEADSGFDGGEDNDDAAILPANWSGPLRPDSIAVPGPATRGLLLLSSLLFLRKRRR